MEQIYYYHSKSTPRFTIAGRFNNSHLVLAIALCSEKDQFVKRLGRIKAKGRLSSNRQGKINVPVKRDPEKKLMGRIFNLAVIELTKSKNKEQLIRQFNL